MNNGLRKCINQVHLWLGLASGIILFVVCATGTIYTFNKEIDAFLNKDKYVFQQAQNAIPLSADSLIAIVQREKNGKVTGFVIPAAPDKNWIFSVKAINAKKGERPGQWLVNPYTGTVQGSTETGANTFFLTVMKLHRWLLLDQKTGRWITGTATLIFVCILLSGIILWLPRKWKYIRQGIKVNFKANWKRVNHDLHNVLGFYTFPVLLIIALTGLCWSFDWYKEGVGKLLGAKVFQRDERKITAVIRGQQISKDSLLSIAEKQFTFPGTLRVGLPEDSSGAVTVSKNNERSFSAIATDKLLLDAYNGAILGTERFSEKSLGQKIAAGIKPIHTGEIYGLFSKIIYFICCLVATSMPVTGTMIWLNKRK